MEGDDSDEEEEGEEEGGEGREGSDQTMGLVLGGEGNDSRDQGIESAAVQGATPSSPSSTPPPWGKGFCIDEREYHKSNGSFHSTQAQTQPQGQGQGLAHGTGQAQGHHYHPFYDTTEGDIITDLDLALAPAAVPTRATHRDKSQGQGQHRDKGQAQGQGQHRDKGSVDLAHVPVAPWPTSIEGLTVGRCVVDHLDISTSLYINPSITLTLTLIQLVTLTLL